MFRFIFRIISVMCLAVSIMFVVIDATRSVGISEAVFTSFRSSWEQFLPDTLDPTSLWIGETVHPFLNETVLATALEWPTFVLFAVLSLLFYILGYRRRQRSGVFAGR